MLTINGIYFNGTLLKGLFKILLFKWTP